MILPGIYRSNSSLTRMDQNEVFSPSLLFSRLKESFQAPITLCCDL